MILTTNTTFERLFSNAEDIHQCLGQFKHLPLLLHNLKDLLKALMAETTTDEIIENLIKYDQSLAVSVLRQANSPTYGNRGQILTLREAVRTIGKDKVKSIYLNSLLDTHFSAIGKMDSLVREDLWKLSYITAKIASAIARTRKWVDADQAYVLGLLHNLGSTSFSFMAARWCSDPQHSPKSETNTSCRHALQGRTLPAEIGRWLAIKWALPEVFQVTIACHYCPEQATKFKPEVKLVHLASILARSLKHTSVIESEVIISQRKDLYITADEWENYISYLKEIQVEANQIWNIFG